MKFIDLDRQYAHYRDEINAAIQEVLDSGRFILGETVKALEHELAEFAGVEHAVGVSSGTDGLLLCLMAENTGPGDEIITSPFTFIATAEVITMLGATPVFADIDEKTFNIAPAGIEKALHERQKAGGRVRGIIPVGLYGQCADMREINDLARNHGLFVIEDACQSFGAIYRHRRSCALCKTGVTSFFPSKPLGGYGDGGMIFTDNHALAEKLRAMRVHGQTGPYRHDLPGINGRLDALQAAVIRAKLPHFQDELQARERVAQHYNKLISSAVPGIKTPVVSNDRTSVYAQYTIRVPADMRSRITEHLKKNDIPYAIHYPVPLHMQKVFAFLGMSEGSMPIAEEAAGQVLSLPMHPFLTMDQQEMIVARLAEAWNHL